jgi:hypothetical protein
MLLPRQVMEDTIHDDLGLEQSVMSATHAGKLNSYRGTRCTTAIARDPRSRHGIVAFAPTFLIQSCVRETSDCI